MLLVTPQSPSDLVQRIYHGLLPYRLKEGFCEGTPPSREALEKRGEAFAALQGKTWSAMTPSDGPLLIEVIDFLSDKEFISAFPTIADFLLGDKGSVAWLHLFATHIRGMSKGHVHRLLPHDLNRLFLELLDALGEKYADSLVKRQETVAHLRKTREWVDMRLKAKR